jgi:hypothetical protein
MKIHHASSIRPIKNKLFTDERARKHAYNKEKGLKRLEKQIKRELTTK